MQSFVSQHLIAGKQFHIFRDDIFFLGNVNGNKARKFFHLHNTEPFPHVVGSYGGHQSNAMVALASIAANRDNAKFVYFTNPLPDHLRITPYGNYRRALDHGMVVKELSLAQYDEISKVGGGVNSFPRHLYEVEQDLTYWVPQGGAMPEAEIGTAKLFDEILSYTNSCGGKWKVLFACGTGTTALFAARCAHLRNARNVNIVGIPCLGSSSYLQAQMKRLDLASGSYGVFPTVLDDDISRTFAKPYLDHYNIWKTIQSDSGLDFDLIYAPRAFEVILKHMTNDGSYWRDYKLLYYHCGGTEGNDSQLQRYSYSKII